MSEKLPESFMEKYKPTFDAKQDIWILQIPSSDVKKKTDSYYEVKLPIYSSRTLSTGGNKLLPLRKKYRQWLLDEQGNKCAVCGRGDEPGNHWNLDHQPPLSHTGSKFIDYEITTQNRVIHQRCDTAQISKKR